MKKQNYSTRSALPRCGIKVEPLVDERNPIWTALCLLAFVATIFLSANAQEIKYSPLTVSNVGVQSSGDSTSVSIVAEGSLRRAQTWQDNEGFHVVVPYATAQNSVRPTKGIKVRRLGQSLEILLQARPGTSVSSQLDGNRLNVVVYGNLESRSESVIDTAKTDSDQTSVAGTSSVDPIRTGNGSSEDSPFTSQFSNQSSPSNPKANTPASQPRPDLRVSQTQGNEPVAAASEIAMQPEGESSFSAIFSTTGVLIILALGVGGLLLSRKFLPRWSAWKSKRVHANEQEEWPEEETQGSARPVPPQRRLSERNETAPETALALNRRTSASHLNVAMPDSLYGAYRIDQEVGKLVLGQPHRTDVLSSRAPADRRAIEASLVKMISSCSEEEENRRASEALEEYGFVARECAALLLATDPFERTNAARALGEIKSPAALPFLLEGLYDSESIVRNQSVASIGELKVPRAIGPLLDLARRHPDVPGNLISQALTACSVEGLDFFDTTIPDLAILNDGRADGFGFDLKLEPAAVVEDLPESSADEAFVAAIAEMGNEESAERLEAAKTLARFRVASAVSALIATARTDSDPGVRSQAVTSLATINHESVFPAVLIGMADDAREVRAAAARSLTHLCFDRTDAYIRVLEINDPDLLPEVAKACIKAGIVAQGIDRLASGDRRQVYETFSIISLLARAKITEPIVDVIAGHPNSDIRIATLRLLVNTGEPQVFEQLRALAVQEGLAEELRTAILEAMYQIDQAAESQASEAQQFAPVSDSVAGLPKETYGDVEIADAPEGLPSPTVDVD